MAAYTIEKSAAIGIQLLYCDLNHEDEFIMIMTFDSLDKVHDFASEDYEAMMVLEQLSDVNWLNNKIDVQQHLDNHQGLYTMMDTRLKTEIAQRTLSDLCRKPSVG